MTPEMIHAQLLRGREFAVDLGRMKLKFTRPDEMELIRMSDGRGNYVVNLQVIQEKCVGWEGVLESDILPDGASDAVPFNKPLYQSWIADRTDLWGPIFERVKDVIDAHSKRIEALRGN